MKTTKAKANVIQFQMRNLEGEEELPVGLPPDIRITVGIHAR